MSDTSGGEGWWLASDQKWYPPESRPVAPPPPPPPAPPRPAVSTRPGRCPHCGALTSPNSDFCAQCRKNVTANPAGRVPPKGIIARLRALPIRGKVVLGVLALIILVALVTNATGSTGGSSGFHTHTADDAYAVSRDACAQLARDHPATMASEGIDGLVSQWVSSWHDPYPDQAGAGCRAGATNTVGR